VPLELARGRSFSDAVVICDKAQNTLILNGDIAQVDRPEDLAGRLRKAICTGSPAANGPFDSVLRPHAPARERRPSRGG
jgi:phosphate starvation-inducible protein PhoH